MQKIIYYGAVDVDDNHFNAALINSRNGELFHFKYSSSVPREPRLSPPRCNVGAMIKKIK